MSCGPKIEACGASPSGVAAFVLLLAALLCPARAADAAELIMFDQRGCPFCIQFDREIAPGYADSAAGRIAPLRRADIHVDRRAGIPDLDPAVFTPTFVLVDDENKEVGRLQGYPGRRWFYPELDALIARLPAPSPPRSFEMRSTADPRPAPN